MKKALLIAFLLSGLFTAAFAQVRFEKGYFIDNAGQKTECLIKNVDWRSNPGQFEYRLSEAGEVKKHDTSSVKEFGIDNSAKYVNAKVQIDRSSSETEYLDRSRNPVWSQEQLFLKVLIEGEATLYSYIDNNLERYFYQVAGGNIQQLVYKKFRTEDRAIGVNPAFKQQLWSDVKCGNMTITAVDRLNYDKKTLEKYFISYNECKGSSVESYTNKVKKDFFNLKMAPGINYTSLSIDNWASSEQISFDNKFNLRIGVEAEFIMPFNKNKWGVVIEPTYQSFSSAGKLGTRLATINFNSVEIPVGVRYYSFLSQDVKLFYNVFFSPNYSLNPNSFIKIEGNPARSYEISARHSFALGAGCSFKRISAELRYHGKRQIMSNYLSWNSDYSRVAFILGYRLF